MRRCMPRPARALTVLLAPFRIGRRPVRIVPGPTSRGPRAWRRALGHIPSRWRGARSVRGGRIRARLHVPRGLQRRPQGARSCPSRDTRRGHLGRVRLSPRSAPHPRPDAAAPPRVALRPDALTRIARGAADGARPPRPLPRLFAPSRPVRQLHHRLDLTQADRANHLVLDRTGAIRSGHPGRHLGRAPRARHPEPKEAPPPARARPRPRRRLRGAWAG